MKLLPENELEIFDFDTRKLWNLFSTLYHTGDVTPEEYDKAKNGIDIKIHINFYILENYSRELEKTGKVQLYGWRYEEDGKEQIGGKIKNEDWWNELEKRTAIMREACLRAVQTQDLPRRDDL